jgi:hypothetical protein
MKTTSHLKLTTVPRLRGAMRCPRLPFRCASASLCCSSTRGPGVYQGAGCMGDICRELQFHRQLERSEFGKGGVSAGCVHEQFV